MLHLNGFINLTIEQTSLPVDNSFTRARIITDKDQIPKPNVSLPGFLSVLPDRFKEKQQK